MGSSQKHIVVIAGETSGDMHGAHLVEELKQLDSSLTFSGLGGPEMEKSGVKLYYDLTKIAVVGFVEVLKHYSEFKSIFNETIVKIKELQPTAVVLIDYPGFNLRLAKEIKKLGIKVIYYISPQVWAWKKKRVHDIKKYVDRMLVIFKFEQEFYKKYNIDVAFVGHPLIEEINIKESREEFLRNIQLQDYKTTLGLLPGSRTKEVERHLPIMIKSAELLHKDFPMLQFLVFKAPSISIELIEQFTKDLKIPIKIIEDQLHEGMNACELCLVASGTATLETAIMGKPMVVMYKTSWITWILAKLFVKIPNIGLVNVVAGKRIVPECIQHQANPKTIAHEAKNIFSNEIKIAEIKKDLKEVRESLGGYGASKRSAEEILKII